MEPESLWLGPLRKPVRLIMMAFVGLTILLYAWLVFNKIFTADAIGMHEMIRPAGRPLVTVTLFAILGSLISAGIYLSDFKGDIEPEPDGFFDIFSLILARISMILVAAVVLVMFYEVVARYLFTKPTLWANELSLWVAALIFLFAGQYAMQQRSHIRIYVIYDMMPRWMQKASDVLSVLLVLAFTFAMVWGGYNDAKTRLLRMETFGTAWDPPIPGVIKPAILFIIVLVAIQAVSNLIADWNKLPEHHSGAEVDEIEIEHIRQSLEK
ncbi:TRAP transporter small permease subunit [Tropicimonas sp. IMCC6043]|uniref:TRAP transporter small permease subunit n=1 Tax=Tropicimonas sp. IMCC6043 TaxID=2510645 RepID=UPI00101C4194|nr:TRAP transporter small permease [Tropicimonas sp. IMCC6043]RYH11710.1 TRAP transporter small permease [Tropicimonas sp. IMCC6043]